MEKPWDKDLINKSEVFKKVVSKAGEILKLLLLKNKEWDIHWRYNFLLYATIYRGVMGYYRTSYPEATDAYPSIWLEEYEWWKFIEKIWRLSVDDLMNKIENFDENPEALWSFIKTLLEVLDWDNEFVSSEDLLVVLSPTYEEINKWALRLEWYYDTWLIEYYDEHHRKPIIWHLILSWEHQWQYFKFKYNSITWLVTVERGEWASQESRSFLIQAWFEPRGNTQ